MTTIFRLVFIPIISLLMLSRVSGQSVESAVGIDALSERVRVVEREFAAQRGMSIRLTYHSYGEAAITIEPDRIDKKSGLPFLLKAQDVWRIVNALFPENRRVITREFDTLLGRAVGKTLIYGKLQIDLTEVCRKKKCGISYVRITR